MFLELLCTIFLPGMYASVGHIPTTIIELVSKKWLNDWEMFLLVVLWLSAYKRHTVCFFLEIFKLTIIIVDFSDHFLGLYSWFTVYYSFLKTSCCPKWQNSHPSERERWISFGTFWESLTEKQKHFYKSGSWVNWYHQEW